MTRIFFYSLVVTTLYYKSVDKLSQLPPVMEMDWGSQILTGEISVPFGDSNCHIQRGLLVTPVIQSISRPSILHVHCHVEGYWSIHAFSASIDRDPSRGLGNKPSNCHIAIRDTMHVMWSWQHWHKPDTWRVHTGHWHKSWGLQSWLSQRGSGEQGGCILESDCLIREWGHCVQIYTSLQSPSYNLASLIHYTVMLVGVTV